MLLLAAVAVALAALELCAEFAVELFELGVPLVSCLQLKTKYNLIFNFLITNQKKKKQVLIPIPRDPARHRENITRLVCLIGRGRQRRIGRSIGLRRAGACLRRRILLAGRIGNRCDWFGSDRLLAIPARGRLRLGSSLSLAGRLALARFRLIIKELFGLLCVAAALISSERLWVRRDRLLVFVVVLVLLWRFGCNLIRLVSFNRRRSVDYFRCARSAQRGQLLFDEYSIGVCLRAALHRRQRSRLDGLSGRRRDRAVGVGYELAVLFHVGFYLGLSALHLHEQEEIVGGGQKVIIPELNVIGNLL